MKTESASHGTELETSVTANLEEWLSLEIRPPRAGDLRGIVDVVGTCKPYLQAHISYIYWMNIHLFRETCAVAVLGGDIVGWCSMIPVSDGRYFLHQLGVAPGARQRGVARSLFLYLLKKLKKRHAAFELELTADRRNRAVLKLNRSIANRAGMQLMKKPDVVQLLEESEEELYVMTYGDQWTGLYG